MGLFFAIGLSPFKKGVRSVIMVLKLDNLYASPIFIQ